MNMLKSSNGLFIAYLDDDDDVADDYIISIVDAINKNKMADVITFKQHCNVDGKEFDMISGIEYELSYQLEQNIGYRYPWIWCAWKKQKISDINFEDMYHDKPNYREDQLWLMKIKQSGRIKNEIKINKTLHYYRFNSKLTETQKF